MSVKLLVLRAAKSHVLSVFSLLAIYTHVCIYSTNVLIKLFIANLYSGSFTGDLYFEKAVNGFLSDLFAKWKVRKG